MKDVKSLNTVATFPSAIGWFAMVGSGRVLKQLTFGHATPEAAIRALDATLVDTARIGTWNRPLVRRLQAYAKGARDDFRDVAVEPGTQTEFQQRVYDRCRRIGYGRTLSYGDLAAKVGRPRAARAIGQCMAANRIPLVVPCHRVVGCNQGLGGYSAAGGTAVKQRLLELESRNARQVLSRGS